VQARQGEEVLQLDTCVTDPNLVPEPPSGELEPGQGVDRNCIRLDQIADFADHQIGAASRHQRADAVAEARDVGARNRTTDDKNGRARLGTGQSGPPVGFFLFKEDRWAG
jgi:hypothetical protein